MEVSAAKVTKHITVKLTEREAELLFVMAGSSSFITINKSIHDCAIVYKGIAPVESDRNFPDRLFHALRKALDRANP